MDDQIPEEFDPISTFSTEGVVEYGVKLEVEDVVPMDHMIVEVEVSSEPFESNTCIVCLDLFYSHTDSQKNADVFRTLSEKLRIDGNELRRLWDYTMGRVPLCDKCFNFAGRIHELEVQLEIIRNELDKRLDWVKKRIVTSEKERDLLEPLPNRSFERWRGVIAKSKRIRGAPKKFAESVYENQTIQVKSKRERRRPRKKESISATLKDRRRPERSKSVSVQNQNENDTLVDEIQEECRSDRSPIPAEIEPIIPIGQESSAGNQDSEGVKGNADLTAPEITGRSRRKRNGVKFRPTKNKKPKTSRNEEQSDNDKGSEDEWIPEETTSTRRIKRKKRKRRFPGSDIEDSGEETNVVRDVKRKSSRETKNPWILEEKKLTCCSIEIIDLGSNSYQCTQCNLTVAGNSFNQAKYRMIRHIRIDHLGTFTCSVCYFVFGFELDLRRHQESVHGKVRKICEVCGKPLTRTSVNRHLWTHMNSEEQEEQRANGGFVPRSGRDPNICTICNKSFKYLKSHMMTHMPMEERLNELGNMCSVCGKLFAFPRTLKNHMANIHPEGDLDKSNWFSCPNCDKRFKNKACVKIHQSCHRTEPICYCETCGKGFKEEKFLRRHFRSIHEGIKSQLSYPCQLCDKVCRRKPHLREHYKEYHPGEWMSQ